MIRVTGDLHGDEVRFYKGNMRDSAWTEDDFLIVCGDFGFILFNNERERAILDMLEKEKPYTICFCDGNDDCNPILNSLPEEEWHGGRVHRIRKNIVHLMRGEVYTIENKKFFVFGGALSIDKQRRIEGFNWWPEEQPSDEEYERGRASLEKHGFEVDYIITHTAPLEKINCLLEQKPWYNRPKMEKCVKDYKLISFLGEVLYRTKFRHWYFGHWHSDVVMDDQCTAVFCEVYHLP